jgi:monoamine oxidase
MARTRLFARLQALAHRAGSDGIARREFMEQVLLGLSAAALGAGCDDAGDGGREGPRIAIIGAGMAGLSCAHVLEQAGVSATLYEASTRVGGRMLTARGKFRDEQVAELGGEFVDSGHMTMRMLASELGLALDDRPAAAGDALADVWWVDGMAVPEATIAAQFAEVAPKLFALMQQADDEEDDSVFVELDNTSMKDWLDANLTAQPELRSVLESAYRGEYGREIGEQSILNLIYLIGSDDPEPFRIFGISDERFHVHEGSDTITSLLHSRMANPARLDHELVEATRAEDAYELRFETAAGTKRVVADHVVFTLPFSVLRGVDLTGLGLSAEKQQVIDELGYGTNAKVMGAFTARVWLEEHASTGSVTSDEPFQQCWDSSLGQDGASGLLTNFLGGDQGVACAEGTAEAWYTSVMVPGAEKVFPGAEAAYVAGTAQRMHWPTVPTQLGSYACYAPGQWAFYGTEGLPEGDGTLHFCGEHTSLDWQGYMEGAAETGALVAAALLEALGKMPAKKHEALIALKRAVPQPAFGERVRFAGRKARLRASARALRALAARQT